jgi:hypothetical protein
MKSKIVLVMTFICLITSFVLVGCNSEITGNEWLKMQDDFVDDLESFTSDMDEVYSLYFSGKISDDDFVEEVSTLYNLYDVMMLKREDFKAQHPIKPESHTYLSKRGTSALDNIPVTLKKILDCSIQSDGTPLDNKNLSYKYLKYKDDIIGYFMDYKTALEWLTDAENYLEATPDSAS